MNIYDGGTGMCNVEINRTSKGDYSYSLKMYFSGKGKNADIGIRKADRLRRDLEKRLGLTSEDEELEAVSEGNGILSVEKNGGNQK